jgi:1-deoxy-D-xylulose-5-phosphate synthase
MSVPDLTVFAPATFDELSSMMYQAVYKEKYAVAIRYPRGTEIKMPDGYSYDKNDYNVFGNASSKNCIVTYGREFSNCYDAMTELEDTFVIKLNRIKPLNEKLADVVKNVKKIYFFEEGIKSGGVGECFEALMTENGVNAEFKHICIDDEFVKQASVQSQFKTYNLDKDSIVKLING